MIQNNIYVELAKKYKKDARFIRRVAHHPFDFLHQKISDPDDHRPIRFRYVGVFYVKPYWRKAMTNTRAGLPKNNSRIFARAPEKKFNKNYINLKKGTVKDGIFASEDGAVIIPIEEVQKWRYVDSVIE